MDETIKVISECYSDELAMQIKRLYDQKVRHLKLNMIDNGRSNARGHKNIY